MCSQNDDPSQHVTDDPLRALAEADWSGRPEVRSVATDDGLVYVIGPLRPAVPALDVELGAPFWCYQHDRFCQYPIGPHRPAGLAASATDEGPPPYRPAGSERPAAPVALDVDAIEADARERTGHPHFGCIPAWAWRAAILAALRSKEPTDDRD